MEKIKYKEGVIVEERKTESDRIEIDMSRTGNITFETSKFEFENRNIYIDRRDGGNLVGKAIYLSSDLDWVLCKDEKGSICLVPLRKEID